TRLERRPQPAAERGVLRRARGHEPSRCLERQTATPPAQSRRRPPAQPGAPRHRPRPNPPPWPDHRLLPAAPGWWEDHQGSTPLRQTRTRPALLPPPMRETDAPLDNIEASGSQRSRTRISTAGRGRGVRRALVLKKPSQTALKRISTPGDLAV